MNSIISLSNILFSVFSFICIQTNAQVVFEPDADGYVSDVRFHELIEKRGYDLVGSFREIEPNSTEKYATFLKHKMWGCINLKGEEIIQACYSGIGDFNYGVATVTYAIDDTNNVVSYYEYEKEIRYFKKKTVYDLINKNGAIITAFDYEAIETFYFGKAVVRNKSKRGIIDLTGKQIIPCLYDQIWIYADYILACKEGKWGILNHEGVIITSMQYDKIERLHGFLLAYKKDKMIVLNPKTGLPFNEIWFDKENLGSRNKTIYGPTQITQEIVLKKGDSFYLINNKSKILSAPYDDIRRDSENYFRVNKNGRSGIINKKGKLIVDTQYDQVIPMGDAPVFYATTGDVTSYVNNKNEPFPAATYSEVGYFNYGVAVVKQDSKYGFINKKGKLIIPAIYDKYLSSYGYKNEIFVRKEGKWGMINLKGETIIPFEYDGIWKSGANYRVVTHEYISKSGSEYHQRNGIINRKNEKLIPLVYQSISLNNRDSNYIVQLNYKRGVVDFANNVIVPIIYDKISGSDYFVEGLLRVENNDLNGYVNKLGIEVFPVKYESISRFENGIATCSYDDRRLIIDRYGNEYKL